MAEQVVVTNNAEDNRYEARIDDSEDPGIMMYKKEGNVITLTHTEVPIEYEGKGVGGALVKAVLNDVREQKLQVIPSCPFVVAYIKRHQEYLDLVVPQYQDKVKATH